MSDVIVIGAGFSGSAVALMLARDGHRVVVVDRDAGPVATSPDDAWAAERPSIRQYHLAHVMQAGGHHVLQRRLPDVVADLRQLGGLEMNLLRLLLPLIPGSTAEPDDDRFTTVTARRSTFDLMWARALDREPGVAVCRGVPVTALLRGADHFGGVPHVVGVRLGDGTELRADLVVDASGRGSPLMSWLAGMSGPAPTEEHESHSFTYTGRYFRSATGARPELRAPVLSPLGSISVLTLPADNDTWSLTLYSSPRDAPLRALRDPTVFERVVRSLPLHEHWLDGAPIGDVTVMSGAVDRRRRFVVDGAPVVTGFVAVGDSHVCTNPALGRGMTMGLRHAEVLVDVVRDHGTAPGDLAEAFDKATAAVIGPWYDATVAVDRARFAEMEAARDGQYDEPTGPAAVGRALQRAAAIDQRAARWLAELIACVSLPDEVFSRPGVVQTVLSIEAEGRHRGIPGPDRAELLRLVGASGG